MEEIRTSLKIDRELLKNIKDVAFNNNIPQNEVIIKYIEFCINNKVEIKK